MYPSCGGTVPGRGFPSRTPGVSCENRTWGPMPMAGGGCREVATGDAFPSSSVLSRRSRAISASCLKRSINQLFHDDRNKGVGEGSTHLASGCIPFRVRRGVIG